MIPGASNPDYLKEDIEIFDFSLSNEEMEAIRGMNGERLFFTTPMRNRR